MASITDELRLQNYPLSAETFGGQCGRSAGRSQNQFAAMDTFVEADVSSVITTRELQMTNFLSAPPYSPTPPPLYCT